MTLPILKNDAKASGKRKSFHSCLKPTVINNFRINKLFDFCLLVYLLTFTLPRIH